MADRRADSEPTHDSEATRGALTARLGLLCPLAALGYFVAPTSYDWIWPINARFALIAALFVPLVLPRVRGVAYGVVVASVAAAGLVDTAAVGRAFVEFERHEVGALDATVHEIPMGARVAALVFDRGSRYVRFSPFLHAASWVQLERGGAVMFTFDDFPQSPVRFRATNRPPRVPPRWEWTPERVDPDRDLGWYDYVLVRGGPGRIAQSAGWRLIDDRAPWRLFARVRGAGP